MPEGIVRVVGPLGWFGDAYLKGRTRMIWSPSTVVEMEVESFKTEGGRGEGAMEEIPGKL